MSDGSSKGILIDANEKEKTAREFGIKEGEIISSRNCFEKMVNRQGTGGYSRPPVPIKPETPEEKEL